MGEGWEGGRVGKIHRYLPVGVLVFVRLGPGEGEGGGGESEDDSELHWEQLC